MTGLRRVLWGMGLFVVVLSFPAGSEAVSTSLLCQGVGNDLWGESRGKALPNNEASIEKLLKIKQDCPQLAVSIDRLVNGIKGSMQQQADAGKHVNKSGQAYQNSAYDPGGWNTGGSYSAN
ncbi:MAG: hypothetical protein QM771_17250 [Nitrospira sp.]